MNEAIIIILRRYITCFQTLVYSKLNAFLIESVSQWIESLGFFGDTILDIVDGKYFSFHSSY